MKRLLLVLVSALALAPAGSAAVWLRTAADTSQTIQSLYGGLTFVRCLPPSSAEVQQFGARSQVFSNGTRGWNVFVCALGFRNGNFCAAVAHISGESYGSIRLGTYDYKGCMPYELHRLPAQSSTGSASGLYI